MDLDSQQSGWGLHDQSWPFRLKKLFWLLRLLEHGKEKLEEGTHSLPLVKE